MAGSGQGNSPHADGIVSGSQISQHFSLVGIDEVLAPDAFKARLGVSVPFHFLVLENILEDEAVGLWWLLPADLDRIHSLIRHFRLDRLRNVIRRICPLKKGNESIPPELSGSSGRGEGIAEKCANCVDANQSDAVRRAKTEMISSAKSAYLSVSSGRK